MKNTKTPIVSLALALMAALTPVRADDAVAPRFPFVISYDAQDNASSMAHLLDAPAGTLRMAPFGMAVKCWGMQKRNELATESTGLREDGGGLGAMGTADESGAAVLLWNHQSLACEVDVAVAGLSDALGKGWRVRRYLVDSRHSNCYADLTKPVTLAAVEEFGGSGPALTRRLALEPYAVSLLLIEGSR